MQWFILRFNFITMAAHFALRLVEQYRDKNVFTDDVLLSEIYSFCKEYEILFPTNISSNVNIPSISISYPLTYLLTYVLH